MAIPTPTLTESAEKAAGYAVAIRDIGPQALDDPEARRAVGVLLTTLSVGVLRLIDQLAVNSPDLVRSSLLIDEVARLNSVIATQSTLLAEARRQLSTLRSQDRRSQDQRVGSNGE